MTELSKVAAQLTAHINYIGSSQTKRVLSTLNIQTVARQLKKEYHSKADIHEITAVLYGRSKPLPYTLMVISVHFLTTCNLSLTTEKQV